MRETEVFYIIYIITTREEPIQHKHLNLYYNANYVTYRGKGSKEYTEVFEVRKYWILLAWQLMGNSILARSKDIRSFKIKKTGFR